MTKIDLMEKALNEQKVGLNSSFIREIVLSVFGVDIDEVPLLPAARDIAPEYSSKKEFTGSSDVAKMLMDFSLNQLVTVTVQDICRVINQLFGINLEAISSLEGAGISIFSKNSWMLRSEKDLFVVETGIHDNEVWISSTKYYNQKTGISGLPASIIQELAKLGYKYEDQTQKCSYKTQDCTPVADAFKGQTIGALLTYIRQFKEFHLSQK